MSADESQARFQRLKQHFEDPITEVYLLFYQAVIPAFTTFNRFLQRETPCVHLLHDRLESFLKKLLGKFIKVTALQDVSDVTNFDYSSEENQLNNSQIFIGFMTKQILYQLLDGGDISNSGVSKFYCGVRNFYIKSVDYVIATYPIGEDLLRHAQFLNFEKRTSVDFNSVEYFVNRYSFLHVLTSPNEMALLQEEFVDYQLLSDTDIPTEIWDTARVGEGDSEYYCMDIIWGYLCNVKATGSSELKFGRLCKVAYNSPF